MQQVSRSAGCQALPRLVRMLGLRWVFAKHHSALRPHGPEDWQEMVYRMLKIRNGHKRTQRTQRTDPLNTAFLCSFVFYCGHPTPVHAPSAFAVGHLESTRSANPGMDSPESLTQPWGLGGGRGLNGRKKAQNALMPDLRFQSPHRWVPFSFFIHALHPFASFALFGG